MLYLVFVVILIIYIHLRSRDPEETMMPLCARPAVPASKRSTWYKAPLLDTVLAKIYQQIRTSVTRRRALPPIFCAYKSASPIVSICEG
jgi:hypothetical protein